MTKEDIERLETECAVLRTEERALRDKRIAAELELREAKVVFGIEQAKSHPLYGKLITRKMRRGWRGGTVTVTGTLAAYEPMKHMGLRGLPYNLEPGALFVLSKGGKTAYSFTSGRKADGTLLADFTEWQEVSK